MTTTTRPREDAFIFSPTFIIRGQAGAGEDIECAFAAALEHGTVREAIDQSLGDLGAVYHIHTDTGVCQALPWPDALREE